MFKSEVNFYNFNPDHLAFSLMQKNWDGAWEYTRKLIESFSIKLDQSHNISIQKTFSNEDSRKYAEEFASLMGQLLLSLLTNPECRISDDNFKFLINIHEVLHTFLSLANLSNTDELIKNILSKNKKLTSGQQKKVLLLLSMETKLPIDTIFKKCSAEYRALTLSSYLGYLKIYNESIYNNKLRLSQFAKDLEKIKHEDNKSLLSILNPYFSCSYLDFDKKHLIKKNINRAFTFYFNKRKREIHELRKNPIKSLPIELNSDKPTVLILWEHFYKGHAMLRVWGPWVKALEENFNVVNLAYHDFEAMGPKSYFKNILYFQSIGDIYLIADYIKSDITVYTSIGMTFWGVAPSNLRFSPIQMHCLGHPATTYSEHIDFVYGNAPMLDERAFPEDKILSDKLPLTYEARLSREEIKNLAPSHYKKGSGAPIKVAIIGSEIKVCAPFVDLLKEIEEESVFEIEFSFHLGTSGMDTLVAEKFFNNTFKNAKYHGWQPYEEYLQSMLETDIVLNPFPFGHTNTLIDTLILGKPCIGLEGYEPASMTEKMILEEVGMRDMFSVKSIDDYKKKFKNITKRILEGDTVFYDRMKMFDLLHAPAKIPNYAESMMWIYKNGEKMKRSSQKRFEIGEDFL